jgi:hypothetical protein
MLPWISPFSNKGAHEFKGTFEVCYCRKEFQVAFLKSRYKDKSDNHSSKGMVAAENLHFPVCQVLFVQSVLQPYKVGTVFISILQMRKLKHREANKLQNQELNQVV